jgi:hypothetical protein
MKTKLLIILTILAIAVQYSNQEVYCPSSTASYLPEPENDQVKKTTFPMPTCESCPDNCLQCSHTISKDSKPVESSCQACDVGYFLTDYIHPVTKNIV